MNVVMVSAIAMNPYVRLLGSALERIEDGVACAYEPAWTPATAARWQGRADVLHIHWPEALVRGRSLRSSSGKLADLARGLWQARRAGIGIVYTAHNIGRTGDGVPALGGLAEELVYRSAHVVHVHDEGARAELAARRTARRCAVIAHGNYIGAYPDDTNRAAARARLQVAPHAFVFLALGQIRPYKGLNDLIVAFRSLPGEHLRLLIAGHPQQVQDAERLQALAGGDGRISVRARFVPDDEVQYYMHAADACVFPYRSGTTSGAAILALSFARPVVAPDGWPFRGLLRDGGGLLYAPGSEGLRRAMQEMSASSLDAAAAARLSEQALASARALDWRAIARQHLDVYRSLAVGKGGRHD